MHDVEEASVEQSLHARLDALASRLEEQALIIAEQSASIVQQRDRIAQLESVGPRPGPDRPTTGARAEATADRSRRGLVKRLLGAAAAATLLAVAKEPPTAAAYVRGTIMGSGGSTDGYGFIGTSGTTDPLTHLPQLGSNLFGLIGTTSETSPAPTFSAAVAGFANTHSGVIGLSNANVGIYGQSNTHIGAYGLSQSNAGVYGQSQAHAGVYGTSASAGVAGVGGVVGIQGQSTQGPGVQGESTNSFGAYGNSLNTAGVYGTSPVIGVWATSSTGKALFCQVTTPSGIAGHFEGSVYINGGLTVAGPFARSAAVPHPDGSYRRLYSQESAEPYFEDFGRGTLVNGQATVNLDPEFMAMIAANDYLVFLTELGDAGGIFVASQTPTSFTVQSRVNSPKEIGFTYRLIFRREELAARRMEKVRLLDPAEPRPTPRALDLSNRPSPVRVSGPDVAR